MENKRMHFHTFDALRFFSFLLVFLHHSPVPDSSFFSYFSKSGGIGVAFFFVLSGFLITYILLEEKHSKGKISLKKFFIRRILRIWPLFYAMLLFAYLTPYILDTFHLAYSNEGYKPNWLMSALFLENYKMIFTHSFPNVSPLRVMWSLCIEEHFYIIWGITMWLLPVKRVPILIILSIVVAYFSRILYNRLGLDTLDLFTNIDYFAFGAIPAYLLVFRKEYIEKLELLPSWIKYGIACVCIALIFVLPNSINPWVPMITPLICGIFFMLTILFTLPQKNHLIIHDNHWVSKLGIYTYGLYLFHTIIINFFLHIDFLSVNWVFFMFISLASTILVSMVSYHCFEKQLLKLKQYFY